MTDIMKQYNQLQRAYEAQAEENADLALLADQYKAERNALQAKLDELQRQEPIGEFESLPDPDVGEIAWLNIYDIKDRIVGRKVYAAPKAPEPLTDEQIRTAYESVYAHRAVMGHGSFSFARAIEALTAANAVQPQAQPSSFEVEAALVAQRKAFMGSR